MSAASDAAASVAAFLCETIVDAHGTDYGKRSDRGFTACKCGREFTTSQGRGLHVGAVERRADKA